MRSVEQSVIDALSGSTSEGLSTRSLFSMQVRDMDTNNLEQFNFSSELYNYQFPVRSGQTGQVVSRDFIGGGTIVSHDPIQVTSGLSAKEWTITLAKSHPSVNLILRGKKLRGMPVEFHYGIFDPQSGALVAPPLPDFVGTVHRVTQGRGEGVKIVCKGHTIGLLRPNYALRSNSSMSSRSGDEIGRYMSIQDAIEVPWGREPKTAGKATWLTGGKNTGKNVKK